MGRMSLLGRFGALESRRDLVYQPSPLGRLGEGTRVRRRDPFGRLASDETDGPAPLDDLFSLSSPVGRQEANRREDVMKVESLLGNTGHLNLKQTDGPTGYFGERLDYAIRRFQRDNNLTVDGLLNPDGETISTFGSLLGNKAAESEGDADAPPAPPPEAEPAPPPAPNPPQPDPPRSPPDTPDGTEHYPCSSLQEETRQANQALFDARNDLLAVQKQIENIEQKIAGSGGGFEPSDIAPTGSVDIDNLPRRKKRNLLNIVPDLLEGAAWLGEQAGKALNRREKVAELERQKADLQQQVEGLTKAVTDKEKAADDAAAKQRACEARHGLR